MNVGEQIINEIVKQGMVQIAHPDPAESHVLVWKENAADQLSAMIAARGEHYRNLYEKTSREVERLQRILANHMNQPAAEKTPNESSSPTASDGSGGAERKQ